MASWDPAQYLRFSDLRLRPALELLARVPLEAPAQVVDLGCGAGNVTHYLRQRWPQAEIVGVALGTHAPPGQLGDYGMIPFGTPST